MPFQNRVDPSGELHAAPGGAMYATGGAACLKHNGAVRA